MLSRILLVATLLTSSTEALAAGEALDISIHNQWQSVRALGMGNAFTAVAKDYSVLMTNPAGLARLKTWQFNGSLGGAFTPGSMTFVQDIAEASSGAGTSSQQTQAVIDVINQNAGENHHLRITPFSGILASTGWGIGIIPLDISSDMTINKLGSPSIDLKVIQDTTIAFGMAYDIDSLDSDLLSWGWTAKVIHRGGIDTAVVPFEMVGNDDIYNESDFNEGLSFDLDLGLLWTPEIPEEGMFSVFRYAQPSFGAVLRNVADIGFGTDLDVYNKVENDEPQQLYRMLDVGSVWEYPEFWIFSGRGTMDLKSIMHPHWSFKKGFHIGFEFDWTMFSWWKGHYRFGLNQGYFTAGASALFSWFSLDLATYGREYWTDNNPRESRVWQIQMNIDI